MDINIVLGLGFGDEGKGLVTDYLAAANPDSFVIRFSGGHQAGHTVVTEDGRRHVFSNFGAGSFRNLPTYWSRYCTMHPQGIVKEFNALTLLGIKPALHVDALCPVTTFYDVFFNQATERKLSHGSCGVGFGATIERNLTANKLYVQDLTHPTILRLKLAAIRDYYVKKMETQYTTERLAYFRNDFAVAEEEFIKYVNECLDIISIVNESSLLKSFPYNSIGDRYSNLIFEGSQGIMLDMDFGFFPHCTRSNTTSRNVFELIKKYELFNEGSHGLINTYYVTRAYQTRHGKGPMINENLTSSLPYVTKNPDETNQDHPWQGEFRLGMLDLDLLSHAYKIDRNYSNSHKSTIVITCLDQVDDAIPFTSKGISSTAKPADLGKLIAGRRAKVLTSNSPIAGNVKIEVG